MADDIQHIHHIHHIYPHINILTYPLSVSPCLLRPLSSSQTQTCRNIAVPIVSRWDFIKVMWLGDVLFLVPQFLALFPWWAGSIVEMCASRFTGGTLRVSAFCVFAYAGYLVTWTAHMFTQSVDRLTLLRQTMVMEILVPSAIFELLRHLHRSSTLLLHTFVRVGCNGKRHSCTSCVGRKCCAAL